MNEKGQLIQRIQQCQTPVYARVGFGWKGAQWYETTKERLIAKLEAGNYAHYDVCEVHDGLGVSFYSANDML